MAKRSYFGLSLPILIGIAIIFVALAVIGFLAGPIGPPLIDSFFSLFGFQPVAWPDWLNIVSVPRLDLHLPAPVLFHIFGLPITNSILASWFTVVVLIVVSFLITHRMKIVPGRVQVAFEFLLGLIYDLCQSIAGEKNGRRFFPVIATIFLFVAFNAWLSLIPGFGSILFGHHELLRGANTDLNTPLAIALISFVFVEYYGLKTLGIWYLRKFINIGQFFRSIGQVFRGKVKVGLSGLFSGFVDIFVGVLEMLSEFIRIVSFTFRLFGNMTAGEILILIVAFLVPLAVNWLVYGFEMLIGLVQALVFSILTLVFATMAVSSHEEESH